MRTYYTTNKANNQRCETPYMSSSPPLCTTPFVRKSNKTNSKWTRMYLYDINTTQNALRYGTWFKNDSEHILATEERRRRRKEHFSIKYRQPGVCTDGSDDNFPTLLVLRPLFIFTKLILYCSTKYNNRRTGTQWHYADVIAKQQEPRPQRH